MHEPIEFVSKIQLHVLGINIYTCTDIYDRHISDTGSNICLLSSHHLTVITGPPQDRHKTEIV